MNKHLGSTPRTKGDWKPNFKSGKLTKMHNALHPSDDNDRLCVNRKKCGEDL